MYYAHFRLVHSGVPGDFEEDVMNKQKIFVPAVVAAVLLLGITVGVVFGGLLHLLQLRQRIPIVSNT